MGARSAPWGGPAGRITAVSLFQDDALVAFDDIGEVIRQRERTTLAREIGGRDIGEELVPRGRLHLRLHVLRIDAGIPVELLDDALRLHFRALGEVDELLRERGVRGLRRNHVVHRLPGQTRPIAISPRFSISSVPALPGVITTYWLKSFKPASDLSMTAFAFGSYGPFSSWSRIPLFASTQPMTKPTPDMPPLTPL